jgi:polyisoprenoid-binding protein YceI
MLMIWVLFTLSSALTQEISINSSDATVAFYFHGDKVDGSVEGFKSTFRLDLNNLSNSKIRGSVDVSTLKTGIKMRDKHLQSDDFFDAEKYPKMSFESTSIIDKGDFISVEGMMQIKDVKRKEVFKLTMKDGYLELFSQINSADYGVMEKKDRNKTKVDITIKIPTK